MIFTIKSNIMNTEKEKTNCEEANRKFMWKIKMRLRRLFYVEYSPRYIRFKGDLCTYKEYLHVIQINMNDDEKEKNWTAQALVLCEKAIDKLKERKIDEGWKMLHAAKRLEVYGNEFIRKAIIIELREEANKLNEWRKNSILKIIGFGDEKKDLDISPEELGKALKIRDEFYHALYYTNLLTRGQFNLLFLILALIIGLGLWYINCYEFPEKCVMSVMNVRNLTGILLFGLLGSTTSSIFHFRNSQSSSRIPEILSNTSITMSRIFVGAGFSVFIFVLLNSEIAASINLFSFTIDTCYDFFTIAFVSGFSERLALSSIQKIIGKKE